MRLMSGSTRMDRRRICDGSDELRALKERLHMAKVNKEGEPTVAPAHEFHRPFSSRFWNVADHLIDGFVRSALSSCSR